MNSRSTVYSRCTFRVCKRFKSDVLTPLHFVKLRKPFVTKINISSMLHGLLNPQGVQPWLFQKRVCFGRETKKKKSVKTLSLNIFIYLREQCHKKTRGGRETEAGKKIPGLQNFPKFNQSSYLFFYYYCFMQAHLCVFPYIWPGLISSFCSTLLGGWPLRWSELMRRLTCFTTIDHWPTFQLHKNTLFYKSPSDDTRQEKGVRLRNERGQANGAHHRRPKQARGA